MQLANIFFAFDNHVSRTLEIAFQLSVPLQLQMTVHVNISSFGTNHNPRRATATVS